MQEGRVCNLGEIRAAMPLVTLCIAAVSGFLGRIRCWMWEHRADRKEAEGCCIERATASDYIHNQMSKQVTNTVT